MSSVGGAEKSNADVLRQNREDYQGRESELVKKHKKDLKRLTAQFDKEVQDLKSDYSNQMDELRSKTKEILSSRDIQNQKKIDDIRNLYATQLKKKQEDNDQTKQVIDDSYTRELEKLKAINEQQRDSVSKSYRNELEAKEKNYSEIIENMRTENEKAWQERRNKMTNAQDIEKSLLAAERDNKVTELQKTLDRVRFEKDQKYNEKAKLDQAQMERVTDNFADQIRHERTQHETAMATRAVALDDSRQSLAEKYREANETRDKNYKDGIEALRGSVNARIDDQVKGLEGQVQAQKDLNLDKQMQQKIAAESERKNIISQYQSKLTDYERQKNEAVQKMREGKYDEVERLSVQKDALYRQMNRGYLDKLEKMGSKNREERSALEINQANQINHVVNQADKRINKALENTQKAQGNLSAFYDESLDQMKDIYAENLRNLRTIHMAERNKLGQRYESQFRDQETKFTNRLNELERLQEEQIAKLKEDQKKEIARIEQSAAQKIDARAKAADIDKENTRLQFETKLAQIRDSQGKEMERANRRHQEELVSVIQKSQFRKA